jgi:hypothetical protein
MTGSVAGEPDPDKGTSPSPKRPLGRQLRQTYRVSAVRRPEPQATGADALPPATRRGDRSPSASPVTDEEIVYALVTGRDEFVRNLSELIDKEVGPGKVISVDLGDVRPASSVLVELLYRIDVAGNALDAVARFTAAVMVAVAQRLQATLGVPVAVSVARHDPSQPAGGPTPAAAPAQSSSSWEKVAPVLAAIGTGIGVIGFVTFVGGLIVWARLHGRGFPAAPALSVYPKQDLLVIGAQTLLPQILLAFGFVILLSALWAGLRTQFGRLGEVEARVLAGHAPLLGALAMFTFVLAALGFTLLFYLGDVTASEKWYSAALAAVGAIAAALVATATRRYLYLAATLFVTVGVFMSFVAYWRAGHDEQVRGAAVIRDHKRAFAGVWLTEGAGRVYLAQAQLDGDGKVIKDTARIVGIDKSEITDLAIAGAKPPTEALADATLLANDLCGIQPRVPAKQRLEDCATGKEVAPQPPTGPRISRYTGLPRPRPLDREGAVLVVLPAISEDATGVVSLVTRDRVWTTDDQGNRQRVQIALSTKPFRAQAGHRIRLRIHLSRRAQRAVREAGGALAVRLRIVAIGSEGVAQRDDRGCVVLQMKSSDGAASC